MKTLFIGLAILACTAWKQDNTAGKDKSTLNIYFASHFDEDTATLYFNGWLVFQDRPLTSDLNGNTDNNVVVNSTDKDYLIVYGGDTTKHKKKPIELVVWFNSKKNIYPVDPGKGKYLLINKKAQKELTFEQTN